jgi:tripartite ATP-independent transporter DctP family solute receptor
MKKTLFCMLILVFMLAACSSGGGKDNKGAQSVSNKNTDGEVIEFTFAHALQLDKPEHAGALKFKELVEEKSDGKLVVNISPAAQLGDEREMAQAVQTNAIEGAIISTGPLSTISASMDLPLLPFLVSERKTMYQLLDGEVGKEILSSLEDSGIKGTAFWESGFKQITSNKEIHTPKDLKGVPFRTVESQLVMDTYKALGANPVAVPFPEVYTSLQQGVVEGQENAIGSIASMKFYEVQDYVTMLDIGYNPYAVIFSKKWFDSLSEEHQNIIVTASQEAAEYERQLIADTEADYLKEIEESGTTIVKLSSKEKEAFREATSSVHEKFKDVFGAELLESAYEVIKEFEQ